MARKVVDILLPMRSKREQTILLKTLTSNCVALLWLCSIPATLWPATVIAPHLGISDELVWLGLTTICILPAQKRLHTFGAHQQSWFLWMLLAAMAGGTVSRLLATGD
ncbi:hypothetical protein [Geopseudomonas aromaticivorans]